MIEVVTLNRVESQHCHVYTQSLQPRALGLSSLTYKMEISGYSHIHSSYSLQRSLQTLNQGTLDHCPYRKHRIRFLEASGHFFLSPRVHNLVLCLSLFKDTFSYVFIVTQQLNSEPANTAVTPAQTMLAWDTHYLRTAHHGLLSLRNSRQHVSTVLGSHSRQLITDISTKMKKKNSTPQQNDMFSV